MADVPVGKGTVYEMGSNKTKVLFKFERTEKVNGKSTKVTRVFTDTKGQEANRLELDYNNGALTKVYLKQSQTGDEGRVEIRDNKVFFEYKTKEDAQFKKEDESLATNTIINDQIVDYIRINWDKIINGGDVDIRLLVLDRLETVGFSLFKDKELDYDNKKVLVVKMKPSSFIIAALVDPIYFYFDKSDGKKLLEVIGRTAPKQNIDGKWKPLDAEIVYQ